MTQACWWIVDRLSGVLEPDERDVVQGDFAESGVTGGQALRELLGLVARRQAAVWLDWRPWLVLLAIVVPLAMVLSLGSQRTAAHSSVPIWMYLNNWTTAYLDSPGARQDLVSNSVAVFKQFLMLAAWSWASGFALGSVSRRTIPVNGALFCLVVLLPGLCQALPAWNYRSSFGVPSAFYRAIFPLIVQTVAVLLPAVWGMYQGLRSAKIPRALRAILWASVVTTMASLAMGNWIWVLCSLVGQQACTEWVVWAGFARIAGVPQGLQIPTLPLALAGPVAYVIAMGVWRRRRSWAAEPG